MLGIGTTRAVRRDLWQRDVVRTFGLSSRSVLGSAVHARSRSDQSTIDMVPIYHRAGERVAPEAPGSESIWDTRGDNTESTPAHQDALATTLTVDRRPIVARSTRTSVKPSSRHRSAKVLACSSVQPWLA